MQANAELSPHPHPRPRLLYFLMIQLIAIQSHVAGHMSPIPATLGFKG